jgi:heat shock 70kDa protein 4
MLKREELEGLVSPLLARLTAPLEIALKEAKLTPADIDSIEMVGGTTRIPSLKDRVSAFFGKPLSFTLNADEAIARGCAFACAIYSPVFKVREFTVHDITSYPIEFSWQPTPEIPNEDSSLVVYSRHNPIPSTKVLTFYRKNTFDIELKYADPKGLPGKMNPWVGLYTIKNVTPAEDGELSVVKIKARMNLHGVLNLESAYIVAEEEVEEVIKEEKKEEKKESKAEKKDDTVYSCSNRANRVGYGNGGSQDSQSQEASTKGGSSYRRCRIGPRSFAQGSLQRTRGRDDRGR